MLLVFGDIEIDAGRFELRRGGKNVEVQPKVLDFLLYLMKHRDRVVTKEELLRTVWTGVKVTDASLTHAAMEARRIVGDDVNAPKILRTVRGRGYQFIADVSDGRENVEAAAAMTESPTPSTTSTVSEGFVGRTRDLEVLREAFVSTRAGHGRIVLVGGEPGVGKTTLLTEFVRSLPHDAAEVCWGRCWESGGAPALWPWVQVMRSLTAHRDDARLREELGPGAADLLALVPDVRSRLGIDSDPPLQTPEAGRFRFFDSMMGFLRRASTVRPIVIVIDDIHAADYASLLFMQFIARAVASVHLLMVGSYRDSEMKPGTALANAMSAFVRDSQPIDLRGFTEREVEDFVRMHHNVASPQLLASDLWRLTGGNPLFVREVVQIYKELPEGTPSTVELLNRLPLRVGQAIRTRLNLLAASTTELLEAAAVIGREFDLALLERITEVPRSTIVAKLEPAVTARILRTLPDTPTRYLFSHEVIRVVLESDVGTERSARLHRLTAEALEARWANDPAAPFDAIAYHFEKALDAPERAATFHSSAGHRAMKLLAFEDAITHFSQSLAAIDQCDPAPRGRRAETLLALGDAQWHAGQSEASAESLERAAALAQSIERSDLHAAAALAMGEARRETGVADTALIGMLETAATSLPADRYALRARVLARLAIALQFTPDSARREALSREAIECGERSGDPRASAAALISRYWTQWAVPDPRGALETVNAALDLTGALPGNGYDNDAVLMKLTSLLAIGSIRAFESELEIYEKLAAARRDIAHLYFAKLIRAMVAIMEGRLEQAEPLITAAGNAGMLCVPAIAQQFVGVQMFGLRREQGRLDEVFPGIEMMLSLMPSLDSWRSVRVLATLESGRCEDARSDFEWLAREDFAAIPHDINWIGTLFSLAESCALLGDARRAARLRTMLEPFAGMNVQIGSGALLLGPVDYALTRLAGTQGDDQAAERWAASAAAMCDALRSPPLLLRSRLALAETLRTRKTRDDLSRARKITADSLRDAEAAGYVSVLTWARRLDASLR